jgi:signal transduction histidine kinase
VLRRQIERAARAEQDLREAKVRADAERLRVEQELQQTRLRQAAILEALPLALFEAEIQAGGRITRRFVGGDLDGLAADDAAALTSGALAWEERIAADDRVKLAAAYAEKGAVRVSMPYRWTRGDGGVLHVLEQAVRISGEAWVGTVIDLTAQRQLEEQLLQAQKLDALGQLTGGVAHDFNNLLAAMLGGLDLLQRRLELGEREQMIVDQMRSSAQQGVELVRRLMAFARKQSLSPSAVDPRELIASVSGIVEHTLSKAIEVDWRIGDTRRQLYADRSQLSLALVNLLINARDAMPDGGRVVVSVEEVAHGGNGAGEPAPFLSVSVADQGVGIPPELIDKVAEPFFTTKPAGEGTGLGLSMVAGFIEQSGGSIRITSEPGSGTTIAMLIPVAPEARADPTAEPDFAEDAPTIRSLLLVDDEEAVRAVVSEQLSDFGIEVTEAEDGASAMTLLRDDASRFDFVLSDLAMPRMNGVDLLEAMKAERMSVPFAIMTGNPDTGLLQRCGETAVLAKPLDMMALRRLLSEQARAAS